jgi:hypothetical protein
MPDLQPSPTLEPRIETPVRTEEISSVEADERAYEQRPEAKEHFLEEVKETPPTPRPSTPRAAQPARKPAAPVPTRQIDDVTLHVEQILERDLGELYASLPDEAKPLFKKKGEEASQRISVMLRTFRVEASHVLRLIRDWLLTIPQVNKFFLEQEAKIKTDAILEFDAARREDRTPRT